MALINSIQKDGCTLLKTYQSKSRRTIVHVFESTIPGIKSKKVVCCNANGNPYRIKDFQKYGTDVYEKAQDGSTVIKTSDGKQKEMPGLCFMTVCEKLFK